MGTVNYKPIAAAAARAAAKQYGLNPDQFSRILLRQVNQESGFNPKARSGAGAVGISQIVPHWHPEVDATDPRASLKWQANYMAKLVKRDGYAQALSIYNSGRKDVYKDPHFAGGQTYNYVRNILSGSDVSEVAGSPAPYRGSRKPVGGLTGPSSGTPNLSDIAAALGGGQADAKQSILSSLINGDDLDTGSLIQLAQQRQQAQAAQDQFGAAPVGGVSLTNPHAPKAQPFGQQGPAPSVHGETLPWLEHFVAPLGLTITAERNGKHAPHSYHYQGRAVDVAGDPHRMAAAAHTALQHPSNFTEMFYTGPGSPGYFIKNGHVYPNSQLDHGLAAEHTNHVHLAR